MPDEVADASEVKLRPRVADYLSRRQDLLIGGARVPAASGAYFETLNPATGKAIVAVAEARAEDIDRAVADARGTFDAGGWWRRTTGRDRLRILLRLADLIDENLEELAQLESLDAGKPLADALKFDVPVASTCLRYYATWADKLHGETKAIARTDAMSYTVREPVGVCGGITPWNYPLVMEIWKIGPALAAGNCLVLKPSEETPLTALFLGDLALEAGVPPGVLNVVPGFGPTAGAALAAHTDVDKVAFQGSTDVGREIVHASAGNLKRISLELGGKSPHIIMADAELGRAAPNAAFGAFLNQGQDCSAGSRIFVQESVLDDTLALLSEEATGRVIGDPFDPTTVHGPQISEEHRSGIASRVEAARDSGVSVVCGGRVVERPGFYYEPTVLGPTTNLTDISREEVFGPVAVVIPFRDEEDAILQSNDSRYGLAAGIWTNSLDKAMKIAANVRAGRVWVNGYHVSDPTNPFGGFKMSGYGRENGREVFDLYTELKSVVISWKGP